MDNRNGTTIPEASFTPVKTITIPAISIIEFPKPVSALCELSFIESIPGEQH
jgi:hypothetical protein